MTTPQDPRLTQGGGYPPGYGPPGGQGPGGYGPPGGPGPGSYTPPGAPGGYGPPAGPPGAPLAPYGGGAPYGPPGGPPPVPELKKQAQTWLIISAISFFFCACGFGIIGVVFCYMAMQAADHGNFADAENKLKWGKITTVIGFVLGAVLSVVGLLHLGQIVRAVMDSLPSP
jgi:hypothetical protein